MSADAEAAGGLLEGHRPARRALFVANGKSRRGADGADAAAAALERGGIRLVREPCTDAEALRAAIRRMAGSVDMVILGGGDGTMNSAAPALIETGLPLGILPLGTANDLARTLGIPTELDEAVQVVLEGKPRRIDLGEVNGQPFFNVASIGLSVAVTRELTGEVKRRWGRLGYALATCRALWKMRPFRAEIRHDGTGHRVRTLQVAVGNGRFYGGGMTIDEGAAIDDGRLNLYSLEFEGLWKLALIYPAFRSGRHGLWHEVRTACMEEVEIRTRRPRPVNTDGELTTRTPARFRVLRGAVSVLVPPSRDL
ncbi:lipid kinase [Roseomonas populi]|uniref:Lipid kinase n=1 Tax=Roseomonas populi TaxID=3121582 RepID=A0ABT1X9H5_9PROT|nr:lipid kinase [Roseomonas pecuniae]MCR0984760.1 lipid kinase [Roseomonas pecuniae]